MEDVLGGYLWNIYHAKFGTFLDPLPRHKNNNDKNYKYIHPGPPLPLRLSEYFLIHTNELLCKMALKCVQRLWNWRFFVILRIKQPKAMDCSNWFQIRTMLPSGDYISINVTVLVKDVHQ